VQSGHVAASVQIGVLPGPNAAPDYFTEGDISTFYSTSYSVHYNSCALAMRSRASLPCVATCACVVRGGTELPIPDAEQQRHARTVGCHVHVHEVQFIR